MDRLETAVSSSFSALSSSQKDFLSEYIVSLANSISETRLLTDSENTILKLFSLMDDDGKKYLLYHTAGYLVGRNIISVEESIEILELKKD